MSDEFRHWSAPYVLGSLEPDERRIFEAHLAGCEACRTEVADFAPIPGLLSRAAPPADEPAPDRIVELATASVRRSRADLERSRGRWRATAIAAVAAAVVATVAALGGGASGQGGVPLAMERVTSAGGIITVDARGWGTAVHLELSDLPPRDRYVARAAAEDGSLEVLATWGPTAAGRAKVDGATGIPTSGLDRIVVTSEDPEDVLVVGWLDA